MSFSITFCHIIKPVIVQNKFPFAHHSILVPRKINSLLRKKIISRIFTKTKLCNVCDLNSQKIFSYIFVLGFVDFVQREEKTFFFLILCNIRLRGSCVAGKIVMVAQSADEYLFLEIVSKQQHHHHRTQPIVLRVCTCCLRCEYKYQHS